MRVVPDVVGPEAELARLARPTGPWLHLLDAAPADARQLGWLLGRDGIVVRHLRGHCGRSTYGLLDEIGAALQLPGDPADDWAGLADLLVDMAWLPGSGHVLVVTRSSLLLAAEPLSALRGLVGVVRDVARARAEEGDPVPFHLVLQDDAVGIATLRARLDAVGARYAALSGWDAEEPAAEPAPSSRSVLQGGTVDAVDLAAGLAGSTVEGVGSVGRAWEDFRGSSGPVRVYVPVGDADPVAVATAISAAVAEQGASCVVVPVPADPSAADPRQTAVLTTATGIWPTPATSDPPSVVKPTPAAEPPATAAGAVEPLPVGQRPPTPEPPTAEPSTAEPPAGEPAAGKPDAGEPVAAESSAGEPPAGEPASAEPPAGEPAAAESSAAESSAAEPPAGEPAAGKPGAAEPASAEPPAGEPDAAESGAAEPAAAESGAEAGPRDEVGAPFELIAANLQWPFDSGSEENDPVDTALLAHATRSRLTAALFRTWVEDPAGGWVRVILGYVSRSSIAEVESERTALVDILQASGAARCCVEVLAATDVSEAHRWLEQRCRPLWPLPTPAAIPGLPPDRPTPPGPPGTRRGTPVDNGAGPVRSGSGDGAPLAEDVTFLPGPTADDPTHGRAIAALVDWAGVRPGVVGIVTAWAGDRLVVGLAVEGGADADQVRAEAPMAVEVFAPGRGLAPVHLRLTRASTRVWTRRAERARPEPATPRAGTLARPEVPVPVNLGPPPVRDTDDPRGDSAVGGFTLVGIDRETAVAKGAPAPDELDTALVEWARSAPGAIALLRGVTEEGLRVYCVAVEETADPEGTRRAAASAAGAAGLDRAAIEAFAPAGAISAFHLDLAVASTRLWPRPT